MAEHRTNGRPSAATDLGDRSSGIGWGAVFDDALINDWIEPARVEAGEGDIHE